MYTAHSCDINKNVLCRRQLFLVLYLILYSIFQNLLNNIVLFSRVDIISIFLVTIIGKKNPSRFLNNLSVFPFLEFPFPIMSPLIKETVSQVATNISTGVLVFIFLYPFLPLKGIPRIDRSIYYKMRNVSSIHTYNLIMNTRSRYVSGEVGSSSRSSAVTDERLPGGSFDDVVMIACYYFEEFFVVFFFIFFSVSLR